MENAEIQPDPTSDSVSLQLSSNGLRLLILFFMVHNIIHWFSSLAGMKVPRGWALENQMLQGPQHHGHGLS